MTDNAVPTAEQAGGPVLAHDGKDFSLVQHARWNALHFAEPHPVLSSAPVGGGETRARTVVNLCVAGPDAPGACNDPAGTFAAIRAEYDWPAPLVGLMTAVPACRLGIARQAGGGADWTVLATVGVNSAHRAGEPGPGNAGDPVTPGTINLIAVTSQGLTTAARAEAIALASEAKVVALQDMGIPSTLSGRGASGTGTDAIAIVSGEGQDVIHTGHYTDSGRMLARAVIEAMMQSRALLSCLRD